MGKIKRNLEKKSLFKKNNITVVECKIDSSLVYISHPNTVVGIFLNQKNEILLVEQFRRIFNKTFLELPGGLIKNNESITCAIKREYLEETGFILDETELITSIIPSIGLSDEIIHIFKVSGKQQVEQNLDKDEDISIKWLPFEKCISLIEKKEIIDAKTIIGILLLKNINGLQHSV